MVVVVVGVLLWSGYTHKQTHNLLRLVDQARIRYTSFYTSFWVFTYVLRVLLAAAL